MKNIDGYVKITGTELTAKATNVLERLEYLNKNLDYQDFANQDAWEAKCVSDTADLDAYRDSGKAWSDYEKTRIKHTTDEPIKFLGIRVGTNQIVSFRGIDNELSRINEQFWGNLFYHYNLEDLSFEQINRFNDYRLDYQPIKSKKHDTKFVKELLGMADKPEIYLSIVDYQKLNSVWLETKPEAQELLVG